MIQLSAKELKKWRETLAKDEDNLLRFITSFPIPAQSL